MIVIENKTKAVKVLKTMGLPTLRLFPGMNHTDLDEKTLKLHQASKVNAAVFKESLRVLGVKDLSTEENETAAAAKKKNDKLNVGKPVAGVVDGKSVGGKPTKKEDK